MRAAEPAFDPAQVGQDRGLARTFAESAEDLESLGIATAGRTHLPKLTLEPAEIVQDNRFFPPVANLSQQPTRPSQGSKPFPGTAREPERDTLARERNGQITALACRLQERKRLRQVIERSLGLAQGAE